MQQVVMKKGDVTMGISNTIRLASIDAGGTTFKCAIIEIGKGILVSKRIPTTDPVKTVEGCVQFFKEQEAAGYEFDGVGIAAFGPLDVNIRSKNYGSILDTPKLGWSNFNLKQAFESALEKPVNIDTDVNGALLAEMKWGAAETCESAAYVTIGTGIGAGLFANEGLVGKPSHPEFGHIRVQRHSKDVDFDGVCSFHSDCLEGLASATAMTQRFGNPVELPESHIGWEIEAYYLAQACLILYLTNRPERIILGGGLMLAPHLLGQVKAKFGELLNGYLGQSVAEIDDLIVTPKLGDDAGLFGGAYLAASH